MNFANCLWGAAALLALGLAPALAEDHARHHHHHHQAAPDPAEEPAGVQVKVEDVLLTDQDGRQVKLKGEVIGERIVVIDFVYTTCTTVCPVVSSLFAKLQEQLGERLGRDVSLVSLSVDPVRDTPARLKQYGQRYGARPGWSWLTGSSEAVTAALKGFGTYTPRFEDHPVILLVGDPRSGRWTRLYGFSDPAQILAAVDGLAQQRMVSAK